MQHRRTWAATLAAVTTLTTALLAAPEASAAPAGRLARPAADGGGLAPIGGTVPGLTGESARAAGGAAVEHFAGTRRQQSVQARSAQIQAAQLHTDWGVNLPSATTQGLHATQSVLDSAPTTTTGGDYVYAPTALPGGNACIEMTTAYTPTGPYLWAWDWCGGRDGVGKLTPMDATFLATYTTTVNGRRAYSMDEHKTSTTANTWTAYLYNYVTHAWDTYFTSSGTFDLPQFNFGWNMFEIYTSVNPSTGAGYYCQTFAGRGFESSAVQVYAGGAWVAATSANTSTTHRTIPSGSAYDCPALTFSMLNPNDHWLAQIGGAQPPAGASYEAESSANTLAGQARVRTSAGASGGAFVGYVGGGSANTLRFNNVTASAAGTRTVRLYYASGEARSVTLTVNGTAGPTVSTPSTGGWDTVGSVTLSVTLRAGANTIQLGNAGGWAPDIDRIVVS
ncbi:carbohydrate-binding protein [Dactylosporangium darangshiense]|uniref:CBM6 domain-containing protein n=1 Tax=Dactylosporangium darangshiense TaxID=579108 RepID=A0ABP8CYV7_9ACTN